MSDDQEFHAVTLMVSHPFKLAEVFAEKHPAVVAQILKKWHEYVAEKLTEDLLGLTAGPVRIDIRDFRDQAWHASKPKLQQALGGQATLTALLLKEASRTARGLSVDGFDAGVDGPFLLVESFRVVLDWLRDEETESGEEVKEELQIEEGEAPREDG